MNQEQGDGVVNLEATRAVTAVVEAKSLSKVWPSAAPAVKGVNLSIANGQVYGLVGGEGAGKSVLLGLMAGLIEPSAGRVLVNGHDTVQQPALAQSSVVVQLQGCSAMPADHSLWQVLTAGNEINEYWGESLLRDLNLWAQREVAVSRLSHGMQRKVSLARALLSTRPILLLDEPTAELDQPTTWALHRWLQHRTRDLGDTVILATRQPAVAQMFCDRIAVMSQGRVLRELSLVEWRSAEQESIYQIRVKVRLTKERATWFDGFELTWPEEGGTLLTGAILDQAELHGILAKIRDMGLHLISATRVELDLEKKIHQLVSRQGYCNCPIQSINKE